VWCPVLGWGSFVWSICASLPKQYPPLFEKQKTTKRMIRKSKHITLLLVSLVLKLELQILHFFTINGVGYTLFFYLISVAIFGSKIHDPDLYQKIFVFLATFIVIDVLSLSILFFLVLRFKKGQDLIYSFVPRDYVVSCIGNPGSQTLIRSSAAILAVISLDFCQQGGQTFLNSYQARTYIDTLNSAGFPPDKEILERILLAGKDSGSLLGRLLVDPPTTLAKSILGEIKKPPSKP
jgi:hypothetical protein